MSESIEIQLALPERVYVVLKQVAEERHKSEAEVAVEAIQAYLEPSTKDGLLGLFADEPELIDQITEEAMQNRENTPLRITRR